MDIAALYRTAQASFAELCEAFTDEQWQAGVPCTPEWRVWDVLSHVAGVTDDIVHGRVEGAATDPWTKVQVERWRDTPRRDLLVQWGEQIEEAAARVAAIGEARPALDCHSHEHDVRHALAMPGNRDSALVAWMVDRFVEAEVGRAVRVVLDGGATFTIGAPNDDHPIELRGISRFDLVRSRLGRRSRSQVLEWDWSEPPGDALLSAWFAFGPSPRDIDE